MTVRKPGIPTPGTRDPQINQLFNAIKENLEIITGARPGIPEIQQLPSTASLVDVINKINEVVVRLNASGK